MDFRVTKGMLGDDGKEPGTGHKEGSPVGNGFYSGIRQTWILQENMLECSKPLMAARKLTETGWISC